ncbi:cupin domain-containing protein [Insolitispirillum peregrinum]|uniref:Transcriptional regulator, XRE family with cupin sensor n=1 Tax=Insolitispirillum peregrinum TaxID=80876 RepID=A0A1N7IIN2_9PROT|nr:cupin domain-containing protein [Insolitispirillum peregrinum]SIS36856.1 transcriptional regulator, XRE family with cupin sensor [Insolitispirillum peregrinum]
MGLNIGARLKAVRQSNGLSQRQLAKRAGVTNATISLIESNRLNPSVGSLKRVLDGVPISLADFFALEVGEEDSRPPVFFTANELVEIGRGGISYRQVGADLTGKALQMMSERYAPGADTGRIPLRHEGEEAGLILSGRLEVTVGDQMQILGPGDAYAFDSSQPHRFRTVGDEDCVVVSACTPPSF